MSFVLTTFLTNPQVHVLILFSHAGIVSLSFVAYEFRNWRSLQLFISLSGLPILLAYFLIPESPRWLYRKGKVDRANAVIKQIAEGIAHIY